MNKPGYEKILSVIQGSHDGAMSGRQILAALKLPAGARRILHRQLRELERQGLLRRVRGGRYSIAKSAETLEGIVSLNRRGDGFVKLDDGESVRIANRFLGGAGDGDKVRFSLLRRDRMNRLNGKVLKIVERSGKPVVGVYQRGRDDDFVIPVDATFNQPVLIERQTGNDINPGDWLLVRPVLPHTKGGVARGELMEVLGNPADPKVEIMAAASRFSFPLKFPPDVIHEAEGIDASISDEELAGRSDLRKMPFVTIDGETARDFDDAVTVVAEKSHFRLYVAIADVSHYVQPGSKTDLSALERGTSVYFPGFCLPMLPEKLSNDICSLKPNVDRLVLVAEMVFDSSGQRLESSFYPSVIRSQARWTYNLVQDYLDQPEQIQAAGTAGCVSQLSAMQELSQALTAMRRERGSLELDIPEPEVVLDSTGFPEMIRYSKRLESHRIIEEFMLAANEAVASFLAGKKYDLPYRIHEPPEFSDLTILNSYLATHSQQKLSPGDGLHSAMQELTLSLEDKAEKSTVSRMLLQSMKQARYAVENVGHFGLAAEKYCHFTSPIRRYPDLVVHRILKLSLNSKSQTNNRESLVRLAEQSSHRERLAVHAERDVQAMMACRFMEDKIGNTYPGIISSVQKFGLFVELTEFPVEGLVHIAKLEDDYYHYEASLNQLVGESTGHIFTSGIEVKISVENVNMARREIDFDLVSASRREGSRLPARGRGRRNSWK